MAPLSEKKKEGRKEGKDRGRTSPISWIALWLFFFVVVDKKIIGKIKNRAEIKN